MCRPATCRACGRTTWKGCGLHVDQVMASVPADGRCTCTVEERAAAVSDRSVLRRIFGR